MVKQTEGLVLRRIKYGESSQIVQIFTKDFGLQSCMIRGVGKSRAGNRNSILLSPGSLVDILIYHNDKNNIKHLREVNPAYIYQNIQENIIKNSIAVFVVEVLQNLLIADNIQSDLFEFSQSFLQVLDNSSNSILGNFPIYFLIRAGQMSGYHIAGEYCTETPFLNLYEGAFTAHENAQTNEINQALINQMSQLNKAQKMEDIIQIKLNNKDRKALLAQFARFFEIHVPSFRPLKSPEIFAGIFS